MFVVVLLAVRLNSGQCEVGGVGPRRSRIGSREPNWLDMSRPSYGTIIRYGILKMGGCLEGW